MNNTVHNTVEGDEYERVFEQYLAVCNRAIAQNKDKFPYLEIWQARRASLGDNHILQCAVYDDRPKVIYNLQLTKDLEIKVMSKEVMAAQDAWPLRMHYLRHVLANEADYVEHPAKLDWGWLTSVFG